MIESTLESWHKIVEGDPRVSLDDLLHEDVVFYSPVVFTPQEGKAVAKLYLGAAGKALGGKDAGSAESGSQGGGGFRYVRQIASGNQAMLEFETTVGGKYVNGIDIITCDDAGKIVEFKVLLRPLQAVNAVHEMMAAMLEKLSPAS